MLTDEICGHLESNATYVVNSVHYVPTGSGDGGIHPDRHGNEIGRKGQIVKAEAPEGKARGNQWEDWKLVLHYDDSPHLFRSPFGDQGQIETW